MSILESLKKKLESPAKKYWLHNCQYFPLRASDNEEESICEICKESPVERVIEVSKVLTQKQALLLIEMVEATGKSLETAINEFETDWKCETCKKVNEHVYKPVCEAQSEIEKLMDELSKC